MADVHEHRIRLLRDDLVGEVHQRIGIHGRHRGRDHLDLALRKGALEPLVEHARERGAEAVGEAGGARLAQHEYPESAGSLLCREVRRLDADRRRLRRVGEKARHDPRIGLQVVGLAGARHEERLAVLTEAGETQRQLATAEQREGQRDQDEPEDPAADGGGAGGGVRGVTGHRPVGVARLAFRPAAAAHRRVPLQKKRPGTLADARPSSLDQSAFDRHATLRGPSRSTRPTPRRCA